MLKKKIKRERDSHISLDTTIGFLKQRTFQKLKIYIMSISYLWATTTVVRLAQILASEAWMLRSVCVSSADVACRGNKSKNFSFCFQSAWPLRYHCYFLQSHLIQQDDLWCFEDSSGNSHPLLLSSTQLQTSFTHLRIVTCQGKIQVGGKTNDLTVTLWQSDEHSSHYFKCLRYTRPISKKNKKTKHK